MMLDVGNKVVYPNQGPCRIGAVVEKVFGGRSTSFYTFALMDESGDVLFVPIDKIRSLGIRRLMEKSEIPKVLSRLSQVAKIPIMSTAKNWKQRAIDNSRRLASGSAFDLAEIVESLTELNKTRTLAPHDRQALQRAKKLLVCEIAEVLGETIGLAEERVDKALLARKA
jgi:CarD family transcriptional regulator